MEELLTSQDMTGGLISRFLTNVKKLGQDKLTCAILEARLALLENYWANYWKAHCDLQKYPGLKGRSYVDEDHFSITEENYLTTKAALMEGLTHLRTAAKTKTPPPSTEGALNLPKLSLPRFSGDILQWETFRDLFSSMVHEVSSIPNVLKLQYLKTSVVGEAAQLLKGIAVNAANYAGAWELLVKRYGNTRVLLAAHLNQVLSCVCSNRESAAELKRLIDTFDESIRSLDALKRPVKQWDDWLVHLLVSKLDSNTRKDWETSLPDATEVPTYAQLSKFVENRIQALDATKQGFPAGKLPPTKTSFPSKTSTNYPSAHVAVTSDNKPKRNLKCDFCNGPHFSGYCSKFNRQTTARRWDLVQQYNLCTNCLRGGHQVGNCTSDKTCTKCQDKHHSMLHCDITSASGSSTGPPPQREKEDRYGADRPTTSYTTHDIASTPFDGPSKASTYTQLRAAPNRSVLLATALVKLRSSSGMTILARALLDQGSDTSLITEHIAQKLRLHRIAVNVPITGVGGAVAGTAKSAVQLTMHAFRESALSIPLDALVISKLTNLIPSAKVQHQDWPHLADLDLADPTYDKSAKVDLLLGADIYGLIIQPGLRIGVPGTPIAQRTSLGWIISGLSGPREGLASSSERRPLCLHGAAKDPVSDLLQTFWKMDQFPDSPVPTKEDLECEEHFQRTHSRLKDGRYKVRLPCTTAEEIPLGNSRGIAVNRLHRVESQLRSDPSTAIKYADFMREYLDLGHMFPVARSETSEQTQDCYYMPHRAVLKQHDPQKKIRVVFNASQKTSTGYSLNDRLLVGPKLQSELWAIVTSWRQYRIVFSTDIVKMYRQILVHPLDQPLQRIVWRSVATGELMDYQLSTVTYGTACAPFLALRVLLQLAQDESERFPRATRILKTQSYVDDLFAGADTPEEASELQQELTALLATAGFTLSKWASNNSRVLEGTDCQMESLDYHLDPCVNTLGLQWDTSADVFVFKVRLAPSVAALSKRMLLSEIARLFDPLGWLSPVLIFAKIMMQNLWLSGIDWDSPVNEDHSNAWNVFRSSLTDLEKIRVPRWLNITSNATCELHGFCDASERAYAAAVYLTVIEPSGTRRSTLVVAKAKVAPVRTCSIPRLELCGALLLSKLLPQVAKTLGLLEADHYAWTDSTVTLAWLTSHASRWKPFVANRVAAVQANMPNVVWKYVPTASNPADKATRGITPLDLDTCQLWWNGPDWLVESARWPSSPSVLQDPPVVEARIAAQVLVAQVSWLDDLIRRHSKFQRLVRVFAYCLRFCENVRKTIGNRELGYLTSSEITKSRTRLLIQAQEAHFSQEREQLAELKPISRRSSLRSLNAFMDSDGLLRVGGRLNNAFLDYNEKHPIIIHKNTHLAFLITSQAHLDTLHGGPQLTLSHLLRQFWIIGGRSLVRSLTRTCGRCARFRVKPQIQLMGQLPKERVTAERAFLNSGVDYAGPILMRTSKGRGHKSHKGFICVFVCLATRAIHLEAVTDYSSAAFLAAFARFTSRRGRPSTLYSDNGTTFTGADNQLKELFSQASAQVHEIAEVLAGQHTQWIFIPPHAPHFGGIWEAGVKAVKHHLRRTIGDTTLTFEELSTLLAKIEACLNSRPLHPLSADPSDLSALTPGHFLIGSALTSIPEPSLLNVKRHCLSRWQLLTHLRDHFWHRWSTEYLHHLQERTKWQRPTRSLQKGDLVLVKNDILPPTKWNMARIIDLHPGSDGLVRVATIRTSTTTLKRPIAKLCLLPASSD